MVNTGRILAALLFVLLFSACANIVPPTGGKKDTTPPVLLEITPADSLLNTRVNRIEMRFDEFIVVEDPGKNIQVSPLLPFPVNAMVNGKKLVVDFPDSLLQGNTTYRISFGDAIKDLHEGNVFKNYSYIFSTGSYFDSLKLNGYVLDAATGKPAADVSVLLYLSAAGDSAVVKSKPMYVSRVDANGTFIIPGLPAQSFRIYALKDANDNLVYDGDEEKIAFIDSFVVPRDTLSKPIELRVFKEEVPEDSLLTKKDSASTGSRLIRQIRADKEKDAFFVYSVAVDTSDEEKRTFDVNKPLAIRFSNSLDTYSHERVFLSYDSAGIDVEAPFTIGKDTTGRGLLMGSDWKLNTVYTLRLLKDFATDTAGATATPSRHTFRTRSDDDYGIINVHVASAYYGSRYLLMVTTEKDTVYKQPVTDSTVTLRRLNPGQYSLFIIVDENGNGKWDTGDLFAKKQPEVVIPYNTNIELKAGWENVIDFVEPVTEKTGARSSPPKRDKRADK